MTGSIVNPLGGRLLVLGGGYSGLRLARAALDQGMAVTITHRQASPPDTGTGPEGNGDALQWVHFDSGEGANQLDPAALAGISHVLVTIPPDRQGLDPALGSLAPLLAQLPLQWLGYLSTTGVYGDRGGDWVDESANPLPGAQRSLARLACEQAWLGSGWPVQVFRLPAIYGPGRSPFQSLRDNSSRLIHKPGQVFSRIHVDDIVGALLHCLRLAPSQRPSLINVADDRPCPSSESLGYAAHLVGCKLPEVERYGDVAASLSPMARSFWAENRRASNRRLCRELGYKLRYPCFRAGYRASLEEESSWARKAG
ncbi:SDR family NAD(P)-dependent oxidoreductase [Synechococcus sp. CS-1324]|uniref:SDR family NAD(P)-dependent oxidoreductase n=1 Tax=Synechococcus sp. CS-1324 TaxID=2847980 RepID=UPI000DB2E185|nr:SDR family NAD(P)-dependent oxidoreductase [Synechococcus sp. CS-1324]MCT0231138.1 SDR family NAD(P)-dependent oxidoreductase [Synechococcus sp. CS-1324]PZV04425.1 MAG: NAD(P)-dependent oxidoreductase [Cyanobium sp.]